MAHHCHAVPCKVQVPEKLLMCSPHWRKVPRDIQARVWATYRDGQEREKNPSLAWCQAADAAVASVATREGRPAPRATFVHAFFPKATS